MDNTIATNSSQILPPLPPSAASTSASTSTSPDSITNDIRIVLQDIGQMLSGGRNQYHQQDPPPPSLRLNERAPDEIVSSGDDNGREALNSNPSEINESNQHRTRRSLRIMLPILPRADSDNEDNNNINQQQQPAVAIIETGSNEVLIVDDESDGVVQVADTTTPVRKRKRNSMKNSPTPRKLSKTKENKDKIEIDDDDDDGSTCPICLDSWEFDGDHRLVSLKCGHLFGRSCIIRWIQECATGARCCPSCKTKTKQSDLRAIYAKKICVVDKSDEYRLQQMVDSEKMKVQRLNQQVALLTCEIDVQRKLNERVQRELEQLKHRTSNMLPIIEANGMATITTTTNTTCAALIRLRLYKLYRERTILISNEPGCRVLSFAASINQLIVSQRSPQSLFPGYGVRFIDLPTFRPTQFLHMATKQVRDLAIDVTDRFLMAASMDRMVKMFDINNRQCVSTFTPSGDNSPIWSVNFDHQRSTGTGQLQQKLYIGTQHGKTYTYDTRQPNQYLKEHHTIGDLSPVINICSIEIDTQFPFGGFMVCKLQSLWFYEYLSIDHEQTVTHKLTLKGPFVSMSYDSKSKYFLISTRPTAGYPTCRYIVAYLQKLDGVCILFSVTQMNGSSVQAVMSRSSMLRMNNDNDTIVAAYLQDSKTLQTWLINDDHHVASIGGSKNCVRMQTLPIEDTILDTCPIYRSYSSNQTYLAALSESKCRIFTVNGTDSS